MSTQIQVSPKSGLTIGTTAITGGVVGRVLFEGTGNVVQEDANFTFDSTLKRLTLKAVGTTATDIPFAVQNSAGTANLVNIQGNNIGNFSKVYFDLNSGVPQLFNIDTSAASGSSILLGTGTISLRDANTNFVRFIGGGVRSIAVNNGAANTGLADAFELYSADRGGIAGKASAHFRAEDGTINVLGDLSGIGTATPQARLDIRAQGALSTDLAFLVRNSADTANLFSIDGTGKLNIAFGGDISKININGNCTGQVSTAIYGTAGLRSTAVGASTSAIYDAVAVGYNVSTGTGYGVGFGHTISGAGVSIGRDIANNNANIAIGFSHTISGDGNCVTLLGRGMSDLSTYLETKNTHTLGFGSYGTTGNKPALTFRSNNLNQLLLGYYSTDSNYSTALGSNWIAIKTGTAPGGQIDAFQQYSADIVAGNAAPHFRTEDGSVIKLYKQDLPTNPTNAELATFLSNLGLANLI